MKTKLFFLLVVLSGFMNKAHSQIGDEIRGYVDSTEVIVNKGRQLLLQKLKADDFTKTAEIYNYLNELTEANIFKAFSHSEKLSISTLTNDWNSVLLLLQNYDRESKQYAYQQAFPIMMFLRESLEKKEAELKQKIDEAALPAQETELLHIFLRLIAGQRFNTETHNMAEAFRAAYKTTPYDAFLNANFPQNPIIGTMSFALGPMMLFPSGKIASDYKLHVGIDFSMDYNRNRLYTSLFVSGAGARSKKDFDAEIDNDSVFFDTNDKFSYLNVGIKAGYMMVSTGKFCAGPYVSIGGTVFESNLYKDSNEDEYQIFNAFALGIGLHTEVQLFQFEQYNYYGSTKSYIGLKLDGGYSLITKHQHGYKGNMPYASLSFVWGIGSY